MRSVAQVIVVRGSGDYEAYRDTIRLQIQIQPRITIGLVGWHFKGCVVGGSRMSAWFLLVVGQVGTDGAQGPRVTLWWSHGLGVGDGVGTAQTNHEVHGDVLSGYELNQSQADVGY